MLGFEPFHPHCNHFQGFHALGISIIALFQIEFNGILIPQKKRVESTCNVAHVLISHILTEVCATPTKVTLLVQESTPW